MTHENEPGPDGLSQQDRGLVDTIATHYRPKPMDRGRQLAFRRRLAARVAQDAQPAWRPALALAGVAAAVLLWFALLSGERTDTNESVAGGATDTSTLYAFVDPDSGDAERPQPKDFLPDDYTALASALDVPVDDL